MYNNEPDIADITINAIQSSLVNLDIAEYPFTITSSILHAITTITNAAKKSITHSPL